MGRFARRFGGFFEAISNDIFKFAEALRFNPTFQQRQLLEAVQAGHPRIACKSGQGPGKTTASAVVGLWRTIRNVDALTVVTAPTMKQCKDVWLVEVRRLLERADPLLTQFIKTTKTKVEIAGRPDWGVKLVTATKEENAQGFHDANMTVICEEASGIDRKIITQFKGTLSNPNSLLLLIGNPNTRDCAFFDCFSTQRAGWHTLSWNAEETPESAWFSRKRNREIEAEFGRDSDVYRVRVLGEFPHMDPNCVISADDIERCTDKALLLPMVRRGYRKDKIIRQFAIDFARYGGDENVMGRRTGNALVQWGFWPHTDPNDVVATGFRWQKDAGWSDNDTDWVVDAGGIGQGVLRQFYRARKRVLEFHNGGRAMDRDYDNKITEAWFRFAQKVRVRDCYIPADNRLIQQLSTRQYYTTKDGKLIIESKDDYMDRGNDSPDRADMVVMLFYDSVNAEGNFATAIDPGSRVGIKTR